MDITDRRAVQGRRLSQKVIIRAIDQTLPNPFAVNLILRLQINSRAPRKPNIRDRLNDQKRRDIRRCLLTIPASDKSAEIPNNPIPRCSSHPLRIYKACRSLDIFKSRGYRTSCSSRVNISWCWDRRGRSPCKGIPSEMAQLCMCE
jgi:hypothetical protein